MLLASKKKQTEKDTNETQIMASDELKSDNIFQAHRKSVKELVAPNGVNPNPLDYFIIHDNGIDIYTMCFYIHKLPTNATFATTFAPLFNFPNVTSTVFIDPMVAGKSSKQLDKRVIMLDTERISAEKQGDRNKIRKIMSKLADAEAWARDIESGDNMLYEVAFLFVIQSPSLENLKLRASDFNMRAREKGIELQACYSVHPEAFLSSYPTNQIFKASVNRYIKSTTIKKHVMDKGALCTIFNHTNSYFSHKNGIVIGHELNSGQLVLWDNYDPSHDGYGVVICGKVGTGKSLSLKVISSRNIDFDYVIRSIDFEPRGTMGEYAIEAINSGGVNYQIMTGSGNILNLFDVDIEDVLDEITGKEFKVLRLKDKMTDVKHLIITMIKDGSDFNDFSIFTFISRLVSDIIKELYDERGIYDRDVDSLYTTGQTLTEDGRLTSGKVKKSLPTITDFYKKALIKQKNNSVQFHQLPYQIIVDAMKDYVKELYYCPETLQFFSREEYEALEEIDGDKYYMHDGEKYAVEALHGLKPYFDGQSTINASPDTPHINIDISQLPEKDRIVALLVAMSFVKENYVKKNSVNAKKAKKMIMLIDELHKTFPYPEARKFIEDAYRTYRKRHVAPWSITQALADYGNYEETKAIVKNATAIFLFKQDYQDRDYLKQTTPLTDSQINRVLSLGGDSSDPEEKNKRRGECCLIDNGKAVFLKIDYLSDSEALIAETDINKIRTMYKGAAI